METGSGRSLLPTRYPFLSPVQQCLPYEYCTCASTDSQMVWSRVTSLPQDRPAAAALVNGMHRWRGGWPSNGTQPVGCLVSVPVPDYLPIEPKCTSNGY